MSKASEWAKAMVEKDRVVEAATEALDRERHALWAANPKFQAGRGYGASFRGSMVLARTIRVTDDPIGVALVIREDWMLSPPEALDFARWILDTFGEAP